MKYALPLLLCLLAGCKEIDGYTKSEEPPKICEAAAYLPQQTVTMSVLKSGTRYQFWLNDKMLWDDCTRLSDIRSEVKISPAYYEQSGNQILGMEMQFKGLFSDLLSEEFIQVRVFELDQQCQPSQPAIYDRMVGVRVTTYSNECYSTSDQSLSAKF